jgi:RNA polymerase sigma-70 factor (ECF subfamily)
MSSSVFFILNLLFVQISEGHLASSPFQTFAAENYFRGNKVTVPPVSISNGEVTRASSSNSESKLERYEQTVVPHLDAAYNLARWLLRNGADAEDLVQEACLRAWEYFDSFRGESARSWLLTIVRNTCYTWLERKQPEESVAAFDEEVHSPRNDHAHPEAMLFEAVDRRSLAEALENLPTEFREVIVLRELEGLSYKEIADLAGIPPGTVMSRLARARRRLQECLREKVKQER